MLQGNNRCRHELRDEGVELGKGKTESFTRFLRAGTELPVKVMVFRSFCNIG
jgi:hypothetical protein